MRRLEFQPVGGLLVTGQAQGLGPAPWKSRIVRTVRGVAIQALALGEGLVDSGRFGRPGSLALVTGGAECRIPRDEQVIGFDAVTAMTGQAILNRRSMGMGFPGLRQDLFMAAQTHGSHVPGQQVVTGRRMGFVAGQAFSPGHGSVDTGRRHLLHRMAFAAGGDGLGGSLVPVPAGIPVSVAHLAIPPGNGGVS